MTELIFCLDELPLVNQGSILKLNCFIRGNFILHLNLNASLNLKFKTSFKLIKVYPVWRDSQIIKISATQFLFSLSL